jgi:hypothetical protein
MSYELEICPKCQKEGVSPWAWLYASWPFHARCKNCGAKLRARVVKLSFMQSILFDAFIPVAFLSLLYFAGKLGGVLGFWVGGTGVCALIILLLLPVYYSKLEVTPEE